MLDKILFTINKELDSLSLKTNWEGMEKLLREILSSYLSNEDKVYLSKATIGAFTRKGI